ncbi:unnamed protein product [Cyclocybe aegerita]|uniref:Uncharacterized protein n=1 Tax=Cyclocybe aegerita TaxID=1973307 RepID=A0A8S0VT13_CYCAE|nr:unnamed protein product [Cyclocybe aegerita]
MAVTERQSTFGEASLTSKNAGASGEDLNTSRASKCPGMNYETYVKAILCESSKELIEFASRDPKDKCERCVSFSLPCLQDEMNAWRCKACLGVGNAGPCSWKKSFIVQYTAKNLGLSLTDAEEKYEKSGGRTARHNQGALKQLKQIAMVSGQFDGSEPPKKACEGGNAAAPHGKSSSLKRAMSCLFIPSGPKKSVDASDPRSPPSKKPKLRDNAEVTPTGPDVTKKPVVPPGDPSPNPASPTSASASPKSPNIPPLDIKRCASALANVSKRGTSADDAQYQAALDLVLQRALEDKNSAGVTIARLEAQAREKAEEAERMEAEEAERMKASITRLEKEKTFIRAQLADKMQVCSQLQAKLAASEAQATSQSADVKRLLANFNREIETTLKPMVGASPQ